MVVLKIDIDETKTICKNFDEFFNKVYYIKAFA